MPDAPRSAPGPVRRLLIRFTHEGPELVQELRVEKMALPRSRSLPAVEAGGTASGFWFELRDDDGNVLYRRSISSPISHGHEDFDEDGTIRRLTVADEHGEELELLVPDLPEATELRFVSDYAEHGRRLDAAEVIGAIRLPGASDPDTKGQTRG